MLKMLAVSAKGISERIKVGAFSSRVKRTLSVILKMINVQSSEI